MDTGIGNVSTLKDVALELKKVPTKNITFTTVPVLDNPAEKVKATVVVNQSQAPAVFDAIKNDVSFTAVKQKEKKEKAEVAARPQGHPFRRRRHPRGHLQRRRPGRQRTGDS